ncbi:MAG: pyruvate dehydrogenase (acetyl-transferring), homodimeric type [Deltaproteobacteria bacterium]|nr:pyruvate dehydrogenase (acetyl-transferring), homodimeric type [Deltaproteobacteria bacterium]
MTPPAPVQFDARIDAQQWSVRHDPDPVETREWLESLEAILASSGAERAHFLLRRLHESLQVEGVQLPYLVLSPYVNTVPVDKQPEYPGDLAIEKRIRQIIRWNAAVMVHRANKKYEGIGGHLSTYASAAMLYEVGFNHVFRAPTPETPGDLVFYQGHASPGMYARAYLEGRISETQLEHFRREAFPIDGALPDPRYIGQGTRGLSSYPHPRLMPDFWQFSTVSMGLGPIAAVYQARLNRYLHARGLCDTSDSRVFCFAGDGETDEPETLTALSLAAREGLDNLVFIVNCNLQRLDGPVRGNGKIIQELESIFSGAGWNVVKVLWGSGWDALLDGPAAAVLRQRFAEVVDGEYQKYVISDLAYIRDQFFGKYPELRDIVAHMSDVELKRMHRGGHDPLKVYAGYQAALQTRGKPTVILAKTVKGYALGEGIEARNATHQQKKFGLEELKAFRTALELPISDDDIDEAPFFHPGDDSPEVAYLRACRAKLGGPMPVRIDRNPHISLPDAAIWQRFAAGSGKGEVSTTNALVGVLQTLMRDPSLGKAIVPIVCDEARTFGMEAMFKPFGIYSAVGQLYTPVDAEYLMAYREAKDGQLLQEGISEAGSLASWLAAATAWSTHGKMLLPFYFYYSMFGFQRVGDQVWQAADMNARGFLLGCTAGRTTLQGEGLQHQDGHSLLIAACNPGVVAYDPTYAYEIAILVRRGLERMAAGENVIYYMTLQNQPYAMPAIPEGVEEGIERGLYLLKSAIEVQGAELIKTSPAVQLLASGCITLDVLQAQETLVRDHGVAADVWVVTSYSELRREAIEFDTRNRRERRAGADELVPYVVEMLGETDGPIIACSDWMRAWPDLIAPWVPGRLVSLGTDGFGMSDTRDNLRRHFEIDAQAVVETVLWKLGA